VISDARRGTQGQAAARGRVGAPVTAEMVAELRGGGKDFGSKVRGRGQRSEIREETSNGESPIAQDPAKGKERRAERSDHEQRKEGEW
jgi:hypothetical protein